MTLLQLYNKYQNSGMNGNPVITTQELNIYLAKLEEFLAFFKYGGPLTIYSEIRSVERMIEARKEK